MAATPMPQAAQINKTGSVPGMAYAQSTPMPQVDPAAAAAYKAAANAYTAKNWGPNGTANGLTEAQNLTLPASKDNADYNNRVASFQTQNATPMPQTNYSTPTAAPMPAAATPAPMSQGSFPGQLTNAQIQAETQARIDKQIAAAQTAASGALTGAKNAFDYTNQTNRDNRTLSNSMFNETHNPFAGQTGYAEANIARSNNLEDTGITNNYNAQVGQINQKLQDILTAAPGDQQTMIDQLTKQERDYGIQLGALTGNINGNNTMQQNQNNFNNGIAVGGLTGVYNGPTGSQGQGQTPGMMSAQSYSPSTGGNNMGWQGQQQGVPQQGVQTLAAKAQSFNQDQQNWQDRFNYGQAVGQFGNGQQTLAGQTAIAQLTGKMPDGTPTNAKQQQDLTNQWTLADQTGTIPNSLADFYGLPHGMQTQAAKNQAAQLGISQQNANNSSRSTTASINNMNADNTRADNAVKLSADGRQAQGTIMGDLPKLTSDPATAEANIKKYFDANAAHFGPIIGADAYDKMKQQALAPYQKVTPADKQDSTVREKAIAAAQKDMRWDKKGQDRASLISEYESYYK